MEVPTLREEELGCGCYTGGKVCCPAVEENEAVSQAEPTGLLNHVFNSPTCVSTFKEMLCAQVCSPDQDKFLEVGEEITQERFDTELSEEAGGIYKSFMAPVHNFTYHVCRSFCERLYDNCKDAQFYYAETVGSQFSMEEVCTFLSTDNAAKTAGVDYHLAPLGSTNRGVVSQPKGPYQAFNMVDDSVEGHRTCWKPTPRELGGCPLPAPGTPFPAPPSPLPPPPVLAPPSSGNVAPPPSGNVVPPPSGNVAPPSSGNETAANEISKEDEGEAESGTAIIAGGVGAGVGLIVISLGVVYLMRHRKHRNTAGVTSTVDDVERNASAVDEKTHSALDDPRKMVDRGEGNISINSTSTTTSTASFGAGVAVGATGGLAAVTLAVGEQVPLLGGVFKLIQKVHQSATQANLNEANCAALVRQLRRVENVLKNSGRQIERHVAQNGDTQLRSLYDAVGAAEAYVSRFSGAHWLSRMLRTSGDREELKQILQELSNAMSSMQLAVTLDAAYSPVFNDQLDDVLQALQERGGGSAQVGARAMDDGELAKLLGVETSKVTAELRDLHADVSQGFERMGSQNEELFRKQESLERKLDLLLMSRLKAVEAFCEGDGKSKGTRRASETIDKYVKRVISASQLHPLKALGEGTTGEVVLCELEGEGRVAAKKLKASWKVTNPRAQKELFTEALVLNDIKHTRIVRLHGLAMDRAKGYYALILEFCNGGSLNGLLADEHKALPWETRVDIALQVAEGMKYCYHEHKMDGKPCTIQHSDLKSANVLMKKMLNDDDQAEYEIKLCDFAFASTSLDSMRSVRTGGGTQSWLAPERLTDEHCKGGEKTDIYSFAMVMFEIAARVTNPWQEKTNQHAVLMAVTSGKRPNLELYKNAAVGAPPAYVELMRECWQPDATRRPDFVRCVRELRDIKATYAGNGGAQEAYVDFLALPSMQSVAE